MNLGIVRNRRQLGSAYGGLAARVITRAHVAVASHLLAASHFSIGHAWGRQTGKQWSGRQEHGQQK
jgi:hypothetical protein